MSTSFVLQGPTLVAFGLDIIPLGHSENISDTNSNRLFLQCKMTFKSPTTFFFLLVSSSDRLNY
jgi:hypothetical protein